MEGTSRQGARGFNFGTYVLTTARNIAALLGLGGIAIGLALYSVPVALIVVGAIVFVGVLVGPALGGRRHGNTRNR